MNSEVKGNIISVKRFEIHDGDGIRSTLFLKGCPLACRWCHNPESISRKPVLALYSAACSACGRCVKACEKGLHSISDGKHEIVREGCDACEKCVSACPASALVMYGCETTAGEILTTLLYDKPFYDNSGGGVTISGGEPLLQPEFCRALLSLLKENGVSTAVDTCGYAPREAVDAVIDHTDTFLFDVKALDEDVHIRATGHSNKIILENLKYIDSKGKRIEIRIPFVPGYNTDQITGIAEMIAGLKNVARVKLLPYHNYAEGKYTAIGHGDQFADIPVPDAESVRLARETLGRILPGIEIE